MDSIFDNTIDILEKSLDIRTRKHGVILSNIANADTPNYRAVELVVENEMSKQMDNQKSNGLVRTHPNHLSKSSININYINSSKISSSKEITLRGDGNSVNMEKEMAELSENNLMYRVTSNILSRKFKGLLNAIQGGKR